MLLANNVLLVVAAARVLLGTLYPLFLDALDLGKISVGPPYFDAVFVPLMAPLVFLMGIGPLARWKQAQRARAVARAALGAGGQRSSTALLAAVRRWASWKPLVELRPAARVLDRRRDARSNVRERVRSARSGGYRDAAARGSRAATGACSLAHLGVAVFIVGVTLVKGYETERDVQDGRRRHASTSAATASASTASRAATGPNYRRHASARST